MSNDLLVGVLISIPVSIATGLLIEPLRSWMKAKNRSWKAWRLERAIKTYRHIVYLVGNPQSLTINLVNDVLRSVIGTWLMVMSFGYGGILVLMSRLVPKPSRIDLILAVLLAVAGFISSVAGMYLLQGGLRAMTLYRNVYVFRRYLAGVPAEIRDFEAEREASTRQDIWQDLWLPD